MPAAKGNDYSLKRKVNPQHTKEQIAEICEKLLTWAYESDGIFFASFTYENYKKTGAWLHQLAEHHPEVKEAFEAAHELIAAKIGKHCFIGDRNSVFGEKILPIYSKVYKEETERKARINRAVEGERALSLSDVAVMLRNGELAKLLTQQPKSDD